LQAEIERLELGLPRPANFNAGDFSFDPRNPFTASESFQRNFASAYQFFFDQMNQRAKEHREQRERYQARGHTHTHTHTVAVKGKGSPCSIA